MVTLILVVHHGVDEDADGNDGNAADSGDGDSDSDECTFAEVGTENFFFPSRANLKRMVVVHQLATTVFFILLKWLFF